MQLLYFLFLRIVDKLQNEDTDMEKLWKKIRIFRENFKIQLPDTFSEERKKERKMNRTD